MPDSADRTIPSSSPSIDLPQFAGHSKYRVIKKLGEGGMGAVYLAEHIRMQRPVALKVMRPALLSNTLAVDRFHQEVRAASQLSHPHIVTAYDADEAGSGAELVHFLVMEFVEGETLAAYANRKGPLPVDEACRLIRQAALGLQHAHGKRMVHRDIKPENLILAKNGVVKILDFGLARLGHLQGAQPHITGEGMLMGTVDYMAPEQAGDSHGVDIRADIYSLGCSLYQLLAGAVPFPKGTLTERLLQHADKEPFDLHQLRPGVPQELAAIVRKMLAKKPADRFATPAAVAAALEPFTRRRETPAATVAPQSRRRWWTWAALLVVVCLAAFGAWKLASSRNAATSANATPAAKTPDSEELDVDEAVQAPLVVSDADFSEIHGIDLPELAKWMVSMQQRGLLPISVTAHCGGEILFNAIATKDARARTFRYLLDSPVARLDAPFVEDSYPNRPLAACSYWDDSTLLRSHLRVAVFIPGKSKFPHWEGELETIKAKFKEKEHAGPRQWRAAAVQAITNPRNGKTRVAIDFVPGTLGSGFALDLSAAQLRAREAEMRRHGTRPAVLALYGPKAPYQFILYEVENSEKTEWEMQVELSKPIFERELKQKSQQGLRPICIVSSGPKENSVYSCVWIRYKHP